MKNVLIVFLILTIIIMIMVFPFKTRLMCHFNIFDMKGFYSIKIWRIRFLCGKIYAKPTGEIVTENSADFLSKNYNKSYFKNLVRQLFENIDVKKMEIYFTGGFAENSFSSAILCGSISSSVQTFYSVLSQKYDNVKLYEDIYPTFNHDNLEISFDVVVSISFIKIIISIIKANIANNKLKENNNER